MARVALTERRLYFQGFLYRRLCRFIPVQMNIVGRMNIFLDSKYSVSHFAEIFASRTYYPAIELFKVAPRLVLDLGAHEGLFSLLVESNMRQRFPEVQTRYILYEANHRLIYRIQRNLGVGGMLDRSIIHLGAVGKRAGTARFAVCKNSGFSGMYPVAPVLRWEEIEYLDLGRELFEQGAGFPELVKIDIEGSEVDLFANYADLLRRTCVIAVEYHRHAISTEGWAELIKRAGLELLETTGQTGMTVNQVLINRERLDSFNNQRKAEV